MNTRERRTKQEYALLLCGEFLRDELRFGTVTSERIATKYEELLTLSFDALGDPSVVDVDEIKQRYAALQQSSTGREDAGRSLEAAVSSLNKST